MKAKTDEQLLEELKKLKAHRLTNEPHRYYAPVGKVEEFIDLVADGNNIVVLLSAANGIGKTYAGANMLANLLWPTDNQYFQHDFFKKYPYPKRGRIISDPTTVIKTIIPTLKAVFPKGRYSFNKYTTSRDGKHFESSWKTDTGWEFDIMTYEQDPKEFESATLGWAWFDEPPPEPIYKATIARFRLGGGCWITATPLTGSAWMYDEIITNQNNEEEHRAFITATVEDACEEHGIRGFLKHENILKQIAQYSEEDKQARIFGLFQHLTGLVYKKWDRKIHVIKPFIITPQDYSVIELLDPHPRNPDALMWVATDKYGRKFVIDELYQNMESIGELIQRVKKIAGQYRIVERRADRLAWNKDQHRSVGGEETQSLAETLQNNGLDYIPASKERQMGIRLTKDALDYEMVNGVMVRPPMLYVFDTCVRTIYEFEHWQYNEWQGKSADKKDQSEKPQDKDDHMMENLGRALINDTGFVPYNAPPVRKYHPLFDNPRANVDVPNLDPFS
jgi:phage terminase large subunit-like protein